MEVVKDMDLFSIPEIRLFLQVLLAGFLGALVGIERGYIGKEAGMRTFALTSIGACVFTILSRHGFLGVGGSVDPSRIAAGIVVGIGFLGAGVIVLRHSHVEGLTTASAIWSTGALGMAVGCGYYYLALITTLLMIIILAGMREMKIGNKEDEK